MRYIWQHIETILSTYNGSIPLTHFLKNYYKRYPRLGSRDRKILSEMAYSWYRCEKGITEELPFEEKMRICLLTCNSRQKYMQPFLLPDEQSGKSAPAERGAFNVERIFPFQESLSAGIQRHEWLNSMRIQPNLFIRIRKDKQKIITLLEQHEVPYSFVNEHCLSLPNGAGIDKLLPGDSYVIQDASSQETGRYFGPQAGEGWYDCCSGAGGKSLLLKDLLPSVKLTVSDKRESILHNLKERFKQYHLPLPKSLVLDASDPGQLETNLKDNRFDNIICDVPCSGSGTWARTPEQLYFFEETIIDNISVLQKQIAVNVARYVKKGGKLFYITCSVFSRENEEVVAYILDQTDLSLEGLQLINGTDKQADSMFIAVFSNSR